MELHACSIEVYVNVRECLQTFCAVSSYTVIQTDFFVTATMSVKTPIFIMA